MFKIKVQLDYKRGGFFVRIYKVCRLFSADRWASPPKEMTARIKQNAVIFLKTLNFIYLFDAQFYPEGLKAYTRNIYKQRTQVK